MVLTTSALWLAFARGASFDMPLAATMGFALCAFFFYESAPTPKSRVAWAAALGAAMLLLEDVGTSWNVTDRHGWLALLVGGVFVIAGLLSERRDLVQRRRAVRRTVG